MFRRFLSHHFALIFMTFFSLLTFALVFFLFGLSWSYYIIPSGLILVVLAIILMSSYSRFTQERNLQETLADTQARLREEIFQSK